MKFPHLVMFLALSLCIVCAVVAGLLYWTHQPDRPFVSCNMFPRATEFNRLAGILDCPVRATSGQLVNESIKKLLDCLEERKSRKEKP